MDAKLTLKLNAGLVAKAKLYARSRGISVSDLVENYFETLDRGKGHHYLSEELAGCLKNLKNLTDKGIRSDYVKHFEKDRFDNF